jgi:hypothetical protein
VAGTREDARVPAGGTDRTPAGREGRRSRRLRLLRLLRRAARVGQLACGVWLAVAVVQLLRADPAAADNCGAFTDCFGQTGSAAEATFGLTLLSGLSLVLDFVPIVGDAKGIAEAFTGRDLLTGEQLEPWERALGLIPLLPVADAARATRHLDDLADLGGVGRHADELAEVGGVGRHADDLPDGPLRGGGDGGGGLPPGDGGGGRGVPDGPDRATVESQMAGYRDAHGLDGAAGTRGSDTLARVDVDGRSQHGTNSTASGQWNDWRREKFDEVRRLTGGEPPNPNANEARWPYHAEFNALARAWDASGHNLPSTVTMYVDKVSCGNCLGGLRTAMKAYGVQELRIYQLGISAPKILTPLP